MGRAFRRRCFGLTYSLVFAGIAPMPPAVGQVAGPEVPSPAGGPEAPVTTGCAPLVPGGAVDILPPPPEEDSVLGTL
jgi:hypothetical protein